MATDDAGIRRLKELQSWADFIFESLIRDPGASRTLEPLIGSQTLRDLSQQAFALRDRFNTAIIQAEHKRSAAS